MSTKIDLNVFTGKTVRYVSMGSDQSLHVAFTDDTYMVVNADSHFFPGGGSLAILEVNEGRRAPSKPGRKN